MPSNQEIHIEPYCEIDFGISFQTFEYSTIKNYVWTRLISIFPPFFPLIKLKKKKKSAWPNITSTCDVIVAAMFDKLQVGLDEKIKPKFGY